MMQPDLEEIRKRAEKKVKKRREFWEHLVAYVAVNLGLWAMWAFSGGFGEGDAPWPIWATFGWGIGIVIHFFDVFGSELFSRRHDDAVRREMEKELARQGIDPEVLYTGKRKRTDSTPPTARLTDDGEIVYDDETREEQSARRSASRK
jgi:hypothetical protein